MKGIGVAFGILMILTLTSFSFVFAAINETNSSANATTNFTINTTSSSSTAAINLSKIDQGFSCLETQVKDDCSGAADIQQIAFTILASPKQSVANGCYNKLKTFDKGNCFGTSSCDIRDTSLAILAYSHLNQDTKKYTDWLLNQTWVSSDIIWFMQQDSNEPANCKIIYDSQEYLFSVQANKKLDNNAGSCLSLANSNYWYSIDSNCYDKSFSMICDKDFIGNLLYKQPNSPTIYVLSNTQSAGASGTINLKVKSKCFGSGSCNYEASAWAAIALQDKGISIDEFVPYLVSSLDNNKQYLPYAFLNLLVDYSEYGTKLIQMQSLNSWEAESTAYNNFYDTALALISLSDSSSIQVKNSRDWLVGYAQGADGCWNNKNVRDTAIVLWALQKRQTNFFPGGINTAITGCSEAGFFCIKSSECDSNQILSNYGSCGTGKTCCKTNNLKTCSEYLGQVCTTGKVCSGDSRVASDSSYCCLSECIDAEPELTQCQMGGGFCKDSCSTTQTETSASCGTTNQVCCEKTITSAKKSLWWLWLLLIILIILIALAIVFRDKIKIWIYQRKSGFKKDDGANVSRGGPTGPSSPGMMPPQQQRPMMRPGPMSGQAPIGMQRRPLPQQSMPQGFPPRV